MNDSREAITKLRTAHSYPYVNSQPNSQPNGSVRHLLVCLLMLAFGTYWTGHGALFAEDQQHAQATGPVDYLTSIKPILARRCFACHGVLKQEAGLRLDTADLIKKGTPDGPAIMIGNAHQSMLIEAVKGIGGRTRMPEEGDPLTAEEINLLSRWINEGAKAPDEPTPKDPRDHWSFRPPTRKAVPTVAGLSNPIDSFLAHEREKHKLPASGPSNTLSTLQPVGPADKATLFRRLSLDLTGLPPTKHELEQFLNDPSPSGYESAVDAMLASPRYGERWGRHWMDIWRYSDWYGWNQEVRFSQPHIWRWRDWIIESLNTNKPYDQMIKEMLAGDELAPDDPNTLRATGYLARNWNKFSRFTSLNDSIEHTGKAFLGLTINCARCHDHMYDPIKQTDFYAFRAFFEPHEVRTDPVGMVFDPKVDGLVRVFDAKHDAPTFFHVRGDEMGVAKDRPMQAQVPAFLASITQHVNVSKVKLPMTARNPALNPNFRKHILSQKDAELSSLQKQVLQHKNARQESEKLAMTLETESKVVLSDTFASVDTSKWKAVSGDWRMHNGRLSQFQVADSEMELESIASMPTDFSTEITFIIRSGKWQSVGVTFPTEDGNEVVVYASAAAADPKIQVAHKVKGKLDYPANGRIPVKINAQQVHRLRIDVKGKLLNVSVDGRLLLGYMLAAPHKPSPLSLWTFSASAELHRVDCLNIPTAITLSQGPGVPVPLTASKLRESIATSEKQEAILNRQVEIARLQRALLYRKLLLEQQQHEKPPGVSDDDLKTQARAIAHSERELNVARKELAVMQAALALEQPDRAKPPAGQPDPLVLAHVEAVKQKELTQLELENVTSTYTALATVYPETSTGRRTALAHWIASKQNPLTARVAVNHIWLRHFGKALVPTVFDFGHNGKPPTHPDLLDWLACEFLEHNWDMKHLHRLMVTSQAYRLSSIVPEYHPGLKLDPDNKLLWHMNARRVEAETVRDAMLHLSQSLDITMGGPDIDRDKLESTARRSVYYQHAREKQAVFLETFDVANVAECYRRSETIVPQQALALSNSKLSREQSRKIADQISQRLSSKSNDHNNADEFINEAFLHVLSRNPTKVEHRECRAFMQQMMSSAESNKDKNSAAEAYKQARASLLHVLLNHHDFVTIR